MEPSVKFDASMYFKYGKARAAGVTASTCFEAVVCRERTSTTRFQADSPKQFAAWGRLRVGDLVRIWSGPWRENQFTGKSCLIEITTPGATVDMATLDRVAWSRAEGWAATFVDVLLAQGKAAGLQVRYRMHTPPAPDAQGELGL